MILLWWQLAVKAGSCPGCHGLCSKVCLQFKESQAGSKGRLASAAKSLVLCR